MNYSQQQSSKGDDIPEVKSEKSKNAYASKTTPQKNDETEAHIQVKLDFIREHLNLISDQDAVEISTQITALLLDEMNSGNTVWISQKNGIKSKLIIQSYKEKLNAR